ncbi:hypothetical protein H0H92_002225 [Tricholoma furcatifolium]|nr:hypothetical protein H0H92_002225 [Tricholoma furcatifolium]
MPSAFVHHLIKPLSPSRRLSNVPATAQSSLSLQVDGGSKETLQKLLLSLNQPLSASLVIDTIGSLSQIEAEANVSALGAETEDSVLRTAITNKLLVGLYAEAIDSYLDQATEAETEAEWWADIERSRWNLALYLLQSAYLLPMSIAFVLRRLDVATPARLLNLTRVVIQALRVQNLPVTLSAFTPASLHSLFPSKDRQRMSALHQALFPHLLHQSLSITSSAILYVSSEPKSYSSDDMLAMFWQALEPVLTLTRLPIELTRQECAFKRKELEKIRDQRAESLGLLAHMRTNVAQSIQEPGANIHTCIDALTCIAEGDTTQAFYQPDVRDKPPSEPLDELLALSTAVFATQKSIHQRILESRELIRPSRLTLIWPHLLLLPPLSLYALRSIYASRASLAELVIDAKETAVGFVKGWLLEPLKDVVKTVRAGSEDGVIVQKEGIAADLASLERMSLSLAKDQLNYDAEQLANLSRQIRVGDLTPVLEIYEEDIKRPLKSAVAGTLLRSVFIQVQKAKVDIDQTLSGIDKLLKSQELTFAFVGVAPAFSIVYLLSGTLMSLWSGGRGIGRRTERLLITQPKSRHHKNSEMSRTDTPPLTTGLLLLSVARLRTYAEKHLPPKSRLREGFLEDICDLENPDLGRADKMKVIERMWRCWGSTLGWDSIAVQGSFSRQLM